MSAEESRDDVIEILNNEEPVKEAAIEPIIVEEEEVKPKPKPKASRVRAKPTIKTTKEPVEVVVEEPVVEEKPAPVKVDQLKQIAKCPDCNMDMTQHTLKYIHKRRGFCKAVKAEPEKTPEPVVQQKPTITQDIVNDYIKENPDIVTSYLRNERAMKAQRKQMNVHSLLKDAF